jgi:uncharacterized coiled-coil protein SlyX
MPNPTRLSKGHKTKLLNGIKYATNLPAQKQLPLYKELKDLLINNNKTDAFHQFVITEFAGNPVGYIGFIFQLAKRYNSNINRKDYSRVYSALCGKAIAPETARRVSAHLTTEYHRTEFPATPEQAETESPSVSRDPLSEVIASLVSKINDLSQDLITLNTKLGQNTTSLSTMRKDLDSVTEQVQDLEQGNLQAPISNDSGSFDNFLSNLPSNSNLTITINK